MRAPAIYDAARSRGNRYRFGASFLPAWNGAFVYNRADSSVTISVPPIEAPDSLSGAPAASSAFAKQSGPDRFEVRVEPVVYRDGERLPNRPAVGGFAAKAEPGFGPRDYAQPPAVGPHVRLSAVPETGPGLARSLKPHRGEGAAWRLRLHLEFDQYAHCSQEVALGLSKNGRRPDGYQRYVIDRDGGRRLVIANNTATV